MYQNKDANNYPDVETRMQHLEFVAQNLFYEAPTLALEPIARMISGHESSPPPQRRYKTELLYKLKFPSCLAHRRQQSSLLKASPRQPKQFNLASFPPIRLNKNVTRRPLRSKPSYVCPSAPSVGRTH